MSAWTSEQCKAAVEKLSPQQREVLRRKVSGLANKQIADELQLTEGTVKVYMERCYSRLGVNCVAHATLVAFRGGLV